MAAADFDVLIMLVLSRINVEEANDKIRAKKEWYQEILSLLITMRDIYG